MVAAINHCAIPHITVNDAVSSGCCCCFLRLTVDCCHLCQHRLLLLFLMPWVNVAFVTGNWLFPPLPLPVNFFLWILLLVQLRHWPRPMHCHPHGHHCCCQHRFLLVLYATAILLLPFCQHHFLLPFYCHHQLLLLFFWLLLHLLPPVIFFIVALTTAHCACVVVVVAFTTTPLETSEMSLLGWSCCQSLHFSHCWCCLQFWLLKLLPLLQFHSCCHQSQNHQ